MLKIHCSGTPYEIGYQHGSQASVHIARCIDFYAAKFQTTAKLDWAGVQNIARQFEPNIRHRWPSYYEEMNGIADGSSQPFLSILAINVRTEISFGLFSDGCTALSMLTPSHSYLAQNWDWDVQQKSNLVLLHIEQAGIPQIKMVTEAGLIGKIGMNSAGVGVCLNAIRANGMDPEKMPVHLGLRCVLESKSREEAISRLEKHGIASACHILVADASGGTGVECASTDMLCLPMKDGCVYHTNHYCVPHPSVVDTIWLPDSLGRVERIRTLAERLILSSDKNDPTGEAVFRLFQDQENYPGSINRCQTGASDSQSLFNIIMDLKQRTARICVGRPTEAEEVFHVSFRT